MSGREAIEARVAAYYAARLAEHGTTHRGVDWNSADSQHRRLTELLRVLPGDPEASVGDVGCGYGELLALLRGAGHAGGYLGIDVAPEMVEAARARHGADARARFAVADRLGESVDVAVASGIFNVRVGAGTAEWEAYMTAVLDDMHAATRRGFAFNCLTSYSDPERMTDRLYYGDPRRWFDLCVRRYSRWVAVLHDYGLYEFTLIVRK